MTSIPFLSSVVWPFRRAFPTISRSQLFGIDRCITPSDKGRQRYRLVAVYTYV